MKYLRCTCSSQSLVVQGQAGFGFTVAGQGHAVEGGSRLQELEWTNGGHAVDRGSRLLDVRGDQLSGSVMKRAA